MLHRYLTGLPTEVPHKTMNDNVRAREVRFVLNRCVTNLLLDNTVKKEIKKPTNEKRAGLRIEGDEKRKKVFLRLKIALKTQEKFLEVFEKQKDHLTKIVNRLKKELNGINDQLYKCLKYQYDNDLLFAFDQLTEYPTHLIKKSTQTALCLRPKVEKKKREASRNPMFDRVPSVFKKPKTASTTGHRYNTRSRTKATAPESTEVTRTAPEAPREKVAKPSTQSTEEEEEEQEAEFELNVTTEPGTDNNILLPTSDPTKQTNTNE